MSAGGAATRCNLKIALTPAFLTVACLVALAVQHGATVVANDHDFRRFNLFELVDPLAPIE